MIDFKVEEKIINDLINIINNIDWQEITDEITKLQEENQRLKAMINAFVNGYEKDKHAKEVTIKHVCEYTMMINEFQQWLEKEKSITYRDCGHTQNAMIKCYDKLIEIREKD